MDANMNDLYRYDAEARSGATARNGVAARHCIAARNGIARIAGVDEAGRGPLAGPVVAAAAVLAPGVFIEGVNDSKKLSAKRRDALYGEIVSKAAAYGVGIAAPEEIDAVNILQATFLAMKRALEQIKGSYDLILVDGNQRIPGLPAEPQMAVTGGDAKSASIAAASIIAKVTRDRMMEECHEKYPRYGFDKHKGYGTERHREMIKQYGLCDIHRRSFCGSAQLSLTI
jgi:ribonuclease HII